MPKRNSRKNKQLRKSVPAPRSQRKVSVIVGLFIGLCLVGVALAQWRSARIAGLNSMLSPAQGTPSPGSPSKENIYVGGRLLATVEPPQGVSPAPTSLVATATSTTQVSLTWTAPTGTIDHYQVERAQNAGAFSALNGDPTSTGFTDTTASAGTAYLYRVCAFDAAGNRSAYSNLDIATTVLFTDDPLAAGVTVVKAQHLTELRTAVNAVRALAGLGGATWTDSALAGITIKAAHTQELRSNLDQALSALGFTLSAYTDSTLSSSIGVKKVHIEELRQRVK